MRVAVLGPLPRLGKIFHQGDLYISCLFGFELEVSGGYG